MVIETVRFTEPQNRIHKNNNITNKDIAKLVLPFICYFPTTL